jgi:hypothetical protein
LRTRIHEARAAQFDFLATLLATSSGVVDGPGRHEAGRGADGVGGRVALTAALSRCRWRCFGLLAFGQNATAQHESVASLYGYFGATVIPMLFVRTLPPYTSNRWLG